MEESYKQTAAPMQRTQVFLHLPAIVMSSPLLFLMLQHGCMVKDRKVRGNAQQIPDFSFSASLDETCCLWYWSRRGKGKHMLHGGGGTKLFERDCGG